MIQSQSVWVQKIHFLKLRIPCQQNANKMPEKDPTMTSSASGVSIRLTHSLDEDGEYNAFISVKVDILLRQVKVGFINAVTIDRQRIPDGYFMSAMDGHSSDLQYVGITCFEPRYGRTKLRSLAEYDDTELYTMYIERVHVDDDYKKNGASDVGAEALRQFLHHPFIKGNLNDGVWSVCSAIYILNPLEAMSEEEKTAFNKKKREASMAYPYGFNKPVETDADREAKAAEKRHLDELARMDANQFLRNGFFQEPANARQGEDRFLVASYGQWDKPLLSHQQATAIQFHVPTMSPAPSGKDADILQAVKKAAGAYTYSSPDSSKLADLMVEITRLVTAGGSVARSNAIHAACANNAKPIVDSILRIDPSLVNSVDGYSQTPLMIAAQKAAGRDTINGIAETRVIDTLLAAGADKGITDDLGLTAYGIFKKAMKDGDLMINALCGRSTSNSDRPHPTVQAVERKLLPVGGPTASDMTGGEGAETGFMDYTEQDGELGDMMDDGMDDDDY